MKKTSKYLGLMMAIGVLAPVSLGISLAYADEGEVPGWAKTIKLKGDLRLRYQLIQKEEAGKEIADRSRGRVRARLGLEAEVTDDIKVGIGVASGGNDPRSTNQTFDDGFSSKGFQLDYAYAEVQLAEPITLFGGKFARKKALWHPSDLLWDGDINVEGVSGSYKTGPLFFNAGGFILEEESSSSDPSLYVLQSGIQKNTGDLSLKAAIAYYDFSGVNGKTLDFSSGTNSLIDPNNPASGLLYEYDAIVPSVEIALNQPLDGVLPYAALFGEYVNNPDPSDKNTGFLLGFKVGDKKVKKEKQWQFTYLYRKLEKDAWLDVLPDSDFAGGKTGYKGHEFIAKVGLKKNVAFALDYYMTEEIDGSKEEDIVQVDLNFKF